MTDIETFKRAARMQYTIVPRSSHRTSGEVFDEAHIKESEQMLDDYRANNWTLFWDSKEEAERLAFGMQRGSMQLNGDYFKIILVDPEGG